MLTTGVDGVGLGLRQPPVVQQFARPGAGTVDAEVVCSPAHEIREHLCSQLVVEVRHLTRQRGGHHGAAGSPQRQFVQSGRAVAEHASVDSEARRGGARTPEGVPEIIPREFACGRRALQSP